MLSILRSIFKERPAPRQQAEGRLRLSSATWPNAIYAIGDVHGCLDLLRQLEKTIAADAKKLGGEAWIVCLGDYVDRGPKSASVLDYLLAPQPDGLKRICLAGNHETLMLDHLRDASMSGGWLDLGAAETLASYGIDVQSYVGLSRTARKQILASHIPSEHQDFLAELPIVLSLPGATFVHAGLRPGVPLEEQSDDDMLWIRREFLDHPHADGPWIVHGHTPVRQLEIDGKRIAVDTGAFATGRLSAVRLRAKGAPVVLHADA